MKPTRKPRKAVRSLLAAVAKRDRDNPNWRAEAAAKEAGVELLAELNEVAEWLASDLHSTQVDDGETPVGFTTLDADTIKARIAGVHAAIVKATPSP